jgi:hypothetical protein
MSETGIDPDMANTSAHFREHGYGVLRGVIGAAEAELCAGYALLQSNVPGYFQVEQALTARGRYADALSETLLLKMLPLVQRATGAALHPCYSYLRIYQRGAELPRHLDRPSCEISTSLTLGGRAPGPWPLCVHSGGRDLALELEPGDMLVYRGADVPHWRERFEGEHWVQVFLHYVRQDGPHAAYRYDGRERIGAFDPSRDRRDLPAQAVDAARSGV